MRIGIDATSIVGDRGGVGWHTYHLLRALGQVAEQMELIGYATPGALSLLLADDSLRDSHLHWVESSHLLMRWRGLYDRLDLYHGTNYKVRTTGRYGAVVTIHDVWLDRHPEYSKKFFGQGGSFRRTKRTVWNARKVITVSKFSAREIAELYELPESRIVTIYNGVSEDFRPIQNRPAFEMLRGRLGLPSEGFVLFVGGADPRKNHRTFLRAAAQLTPRLKGRAVVLVGDPEHPFGSFREAARSLGLERHVLCPGRLERQDIQLLYSYADLFVFPSLYEGFGMPVIEAMACGAPTITSSTSALPEIAGDAAVLVNPENAEELAEAMGRLLEDHGLRESLRARGLERVKEFTWKRAASRTAALYYELCH